MIHTLDILDPTTAQAALALQRESYAVESALIDYPALPPLYESTADLQHSGETFLAYLDAADIIGVLSFARHAQSLEICRLVVSPRHFQRGIGSALLHAVEQHASPGTTITVSTAERNTPAVRLYQKHGYTITRRHALPDGLVLVKLAKPTP
jgi:ribosomal protein S18 acetylase RimI-like enzyme